MKPPASEVGPGLVEPGAGGRRSPSWRERWFAFRIRTIAKPAFQRWAAGFPLTRRIARRNTRALFDLCAGFVYAQTLFACIRLDLFAMLEDGPLAAGDLAVRLSLPPDNAVRLLKAAASLNLLRTLPDGRFALADLGAALIGNPAVAAMVRHHALLYDDLRDPVALLRGEAGPTRLSTYWPYAGAGNGTSLGSESVAAYSALMAQSQALIAEDILEAYPLSRHRCVLDVGGGEGAFLRMALRATPGLSAKLFDLPAVAERATQHFAAEGLAGRVEAVGGDFRRDALPRGADAIAVVRVVHDHDDATVRSLLRAAYDALPPGGTLILAEPMAATAGAEPIADAYFGFYLLAMGSGRCRTQAELRAFLTEAGFDRIRLRRTRRPLLTCVLVSQRMDNL